jgi:hypothetical protein
MMYFGLSDIVDSHVNRRQIRQGISIGIKGNERVFERQSSSLRQRLYHESPLKTWSMIYDQYERGRWLRSL